MKYSPIVSVLIAGLFASSCSTQKQASINASSSLVSNGKLWSSLFQQRAAEYKALCFQAYNIARLRLDQRLQDAPLRPLAIVTDIDETVLDNSPNAVHQALQGKDYEPQAWYSWTSKASADTLAGSASFFKYAASRGVEVFYITNRDEKERESTLANLRKFNFPFTDNHHLLLKETSSSKESRRVQVLKSHEIVLLLGDNLSDFSELFDKLSENNREDITRQQSGNFGNKFIVLPNATYGDWENAIFKYNYRLTPAEKENIIRKILKNE